MREAVRSSTAIFLVILLVIMTVGGISGAIIATDQPAVHVVAGDVR